MKLYRIGLYLVLMSFMFSVHAEEVSRVILLGGSSVKTSYLPKGTKHEDALKELLQEAYPEQKVEVYNWADNGESIARYFLRETYENDYAGAVGADIAVIRFGTNDQKIMSLEEYHHQLTQLVSVLERDFPGIQVFLETGIYVDFPAHYRHDRNITLVPFWDVSRRIAEERNLPLVDYFTISKNETLKGNWDLRVRARPAGQKEFVLDGSQDAGKENDPAWFTDIHPNPVGTRLAAAAETESIKAKFPDALPAGNKKSDRPAVSIEAYEELLNFTRDRLPNKKPAPKASPNPDDLQAPVRK